MNEQAHNLTQRPPVIVVMGHIDHGKSTLLDYIRKSNVVESEAGGITQHISAYEVEHEHEGNTKKITFLDTPGHEAFQAMRSRGARVADIAVLVVAADDGVKEQTKEAYKAIEEAKIPFVVAINKIDKPNANPQMTINSLIEEGIYLEGFGGDISYAKVSAKTGEGIDDLLDIILLTAEVEEFKADTSLPAEGAVIESNINPKTGISATLVIKNGCVSQGQFVVAGNALAPVRMMEDFTGKKIKEACVSSPIRITGFSDIPEVGSRFHTYAKRKDAEKAISEKENLINTPLQSTNRISTEEHVVIPIVIKADVTGSIEAILHEIQKLETDRVSFEILMTGLGDITEGDVRRLANSERATVIGFNTHIEPNAKELADRSDVTYAHFSIIYDLAEWLKERADANRPKITEKEIVGRAKILKTFSRSKDKQIIGGKVLEGTLEVGAICTILRRDEEVEEGKIVGLQQQKASANTVSAGNEFGGNIEAKLEIAPGDIVEAYRLVQK